MEWGARWAGAAAALLLVAAACSGDDGLVPEGLGTGDPGDGDRTGEEIADRIVDDLIDLDPGSEDEFLDVAVEELTGFGGLSLAVDGSTIWVADFEAGAVRSVDLDTGEVGDDIKVDRGPVGIAADDDEVWVTNSDSFDHTVMKIDGTTGEIELTVELEAGTSPTGVALTDDHAWVAVNGTGALAMIDRATGSIDGYIGGDPDLGSSGYVDVLATDDDLWALDRNCGQLRRIDPAAGTVEETYDDLGFEASEPETCTGAIAARGPLRLAEFDGGIFVLSEVVEDGGGLQVGRVYRIDQASGEARVVADLPVQVGVAVPLGLPALVVEDGGIWFSGGDRSLRMARAGGRIDAVLGGTGPVVSLLEVDGHVWHLVINRRGTEGSGLYGVDAAEVLAATEP